MSNINNYFIVFMMGGIWGMLISIHRILVKMRSLLEKILLELP